MRQRCVDGGTTIDAPHLSGCACEACPQCGGVLMACGCVLCLLPEAVQATCGGDVCFLPAQIWEPLLPVRRPYPCPSRRWV